jgi:hypothetical protein
MNPPEAREIYFYYGGVVFLSLLLFVLAGRKRKGMRLRLKGGTRAPPLEDAEPDNLIHLHGKSDQTPTRFSHVQPAGERPLNVVFNYNGHSWDAYEVLGLAAGSSMEKVEHAYRASLESVDVGSRPFMEAAFHAIQAEWKSYKSAGGR